MKELDAMQIYIRVAELSSFSAAGNNLGVPKSSVSLAVQQLEELLGTRLLNRTTRTVNMTPDGLVFYERCKDMLADVEELKTLFRDDLSSLTGRLRVDMPQALSRDVVLPRLPEFMNQYPNLDIELSSTDRKVDLVQDGFDCVLRIGGLENSSLVARSFGECQIINCVSAGYIEQHGCPAKPEDLGEHFIVRYAQSLGYLDAGFEYLDDNKKEQLIPMRGRLTVNNTDAYLQACLAGFGLIQVPAHGVIGYLERGELVRILPDYQMAAMPVSLLYANRRHLPKRVRVFMEWLEAVVKPRLCLRVTD